MDVVKNLFHKSFFVVLLLVFLLLPGPLLANQPPPEKTYSTPKLADIIPIASTLSVRFVKLENNLKGALNIAKIEAKYALLTENLDDLSSRLQQLEKRDNRHPKNSLEFAHLRRTVQNKRLELEGLSRPLRGEIRRLDSWRQEWLAEKGRWDDWKASLLKGREIDQLKQTFVQVDHTINTALNLVRQRLEDTLTLQFNIFTALGKLDLLGVGSIADARQHSLDNHSPSILSAEFLSRCTRSDLWSAAWKGLRFIVNFEGYSVALHGWNFILIVLFFILVMGVVHKSRTALSKSESWKFIPERPISVSLFIVILCAILFSSYLPSRGALTTVYFVIGGITCARILGKVIKSAWQRQILYGVMITFVINAILFQVNFPQPLFRLYIFFVCLLALYFFFRWNKEVSAQNQSGFYLWLFRLGCGLVLVILLAEIFGKAGLSSYLFVSVVFSVTSIFPYMLLMYMIHGGLQWVFYSSPVWQIKLLRSDASYLVRKVSFLFFAPIVLFAVLPGLLSSWGVYDDISSATAGFLSLGFFIGTMWISVATILTSLMVFYIALLASHILPRVLLDEMVIGYKIQRGVQNSIGKLIRYSIVFIGLIFAFMALGFDFTKLTIIMGALGVGIGFGLQGIVNNFVSGLILLFERPLREGDTIELGEKSARIKKIGLRATIVETFDQADVIIPNADLINNQVINWTLANRQVRLSVPVGVAYGSDVPTVVELLLECAKQHDNVAKSPAPEVLFLSFGESSLDFELRAWIPDADLRLKVRSDLYHAIEKIFRESDIEIPFPQMDLHLRSSEEGGNVPTPEPEPEA